MRDPHLPRTGLVALVALALLASLDVAHAKPPPEPVVARAPAWLEGRLTTSFLAGWHDPGAGPLHGVVARGAFHLDRQELRVAGSHAMAESVRLRPGTTFALDPTAHAQIDLGAASALDGRLRISDAKMGGVRGVVVAPTGRTALAGAFDLELLAGNLTVCNQDQCRVVRGGTWTERRPVPDHATTNPHAQSLPYETYEVRQAVRITVHAGAASLEPSPEASSGCQAGPCAPAEATFFWTPELTAQLAGRVRADETPAGRTLASPEFVWNVAASPGPREESLRIRASDESGTWSAFDQDSARRVPYSQFRAKADPWPSPGTMIAAIASVAALAVWKHRWLALLSLPGRLERDAVLESGTRGRILELVRAHPGISTVEIRDRLGLGWGTTLHHLRILGRHGLVSSVTTGQRRSFFVPGQCDASLRPGAALLKIPSARRVFEAILQRPGASQVALARATGLAASTLSWHVRRMVAAGVLEAPRRGRELSLRPLPRALQALAAAGASPPRAAADAKPDPPRHDTLNAPA